MDNWINIFATGPFLIDAFLWNCDPCAWPITTFEVPKVTRSHSVVGEGTSEMCCPCSVNSDKLPYITPKIELKN